MLANGGSAQQYTSSVMSGNADCAELVYFLWDATTELTRISPDVRTVLSCSKDGLSIYMNSFSTLMEFMRSRRRKRDMMEEDEEE